MDKYRVDLYLAWAIVYSTEVFAISRREAWLEVYRSDVWENLKREADIKGYTLLWDATII